MGDDIPHQTPVPVPTYGQPQPPQPQAQQAAPVPMSTPTEPQQTVAPTTEVASKDVTMTDDQAASPAPAAPSTNAPSPAPARTGTPLRTTGTGQETNTSRAASQHPDPTFTMPDSAPPHGAPVRQYLNTKVTPHLLDGMKMLAKDRPKDPLRALGEFLLERSKEFDTKE